MSRPKKAMPAYRHHISGQAIVTLGGKDFYLGQYDTPQSRSRYLSLLAEYNANGLETPNQPTHQADQPITIRCVTAEFRESIENRPAELNRFGRLLVALEDDYGDEPAVDFGPRKLAAMRELFIAAGNCRSYCNAQTRQIVRIFKYAVSRELVGPDILTRLQTLDPLRRVRTEAKESTPRQPVDVAVISATIKHLAPR